MESLLLDRRGIPTPVVPSSRPRRSENCPHSSTPLQEVFGSEQAELSADDWLHELNESEDLPASAGEWRLITTKASTRLASRVNVSSFSTELLSA
jgi:hypothetical protein